MLTKIRSVLAGMTPALPTEPPSPSPIPDVVKAQDNLKQKQSRRGATKADVERFTADLTAASLALRQAETAEGECLVDGCDATAATEARRQANDHVRVLEAALTVAIQKDEVAQVQVQQAERELEIAVKEEARARLLALTQEGEEIFVHIKLFRADLVRELTALRLAGGIEPYSEREIMGQFDFYVAIANRSASADAADSGAFRKYNNWTACVEAVCGKPQP